MRARKKNTLCDLNTAFNSCLRSSADRGIFSLQRRFITFGRTLQLLSTLVITCSFILSSTATAQQSSSLEEVVFSKLPGDNIQINLTIKGNAGEISSFKTDNPARIALDFYGMTENLSNNITNINQGMVNKVVAIETTDRTRVIINLTDSARYKLDEAVDGYSVTVFNKSTDDFKQTEPKPFASRPNITSSTKVSNIDFRRSKAGGGNLIVDLNDDSVTIDTREQDGEIIIDILGATLPAEFEKRLDVNDFATPVQTIDAFQNNENVRLVVVPQGEHQHLSFHTGNRFTLVIDPIVKTKEEIRKEQQSELGYSGERLSINFQKIEVRAALAVIADFTGINFVTSDSVNGEITINLRDVPWDQALEVILKAKGLAQRKNGNVIWVAPTEEIAKIEQDQLKADAVVTEFAPLVSEIITINYAKAADIAEVVKSVKMIRQGGATSRLNSPLRNVAETDKNSLLTSRGSVSVDERTNSLLVQDIASKITELRKVIDQLDKPVRQVLIETRIVEASDQFSRELGARLGFQRLTENAQFPGASGSNVGDVISGGTTEGNTIISDSRIDGEPGLIFDVSRGTPGGLAVDLGANGIDGNLPASYAFDIFRAGVGFSNLITLELSALEADGRGKIVASPRLITANQKEAVIKQGEERVFTVFGDNDVEVETKEAVLALEVTPQITPDDRIILDVKVTQDSFIPNADQNIAAALRKKEIITQVLADNGETIVIGGIYQEDTSSGVTKVPLLGDIPIIGNLFKKRSSRDARVELLIFMTPKIISPKLNLG